MALLLALCAAGCGSRKPRIVVWIEVDTLRADALGCYGNHATGENGVLPTPNLDALAADGQRFEHAYSTAPWTIPSLVSQLSGEWPWEHGVRRLLEIAPAESVPLVPRMRELGWRTAGVTTNFIATSKQGFGRGFERFDDSLAQGHEGSHSPEALAKLLGFGDELAGDPGKGLFLFGWLFEPHYRYEEHAGLRFGPEYHGSLKGDEELNDLLARREQLTAEDALFLRGRYQSEVAYVDRAIGEFVAELKRRGWYDEALIVFTADHGEEILDHGWIGHSVTLHEELVHVPWIVKLPASEAAARKGKSVEDVVSLIDLPATLLDWMGAQPRSPNGGLLGHSRSLLPVLRTGERSARRWVYLHTDFEPVLDSALAPEKRGNAWGVIDAQTALKWVVDHKHSPPRGSLYDLAHDPLEKNDLFERLGPGREAPAAALARTARASARGARAGRRRCCPEEPWIAPPADLDGAGPALLQERR
ncbi:MAG: sulfatase [Planctomycetes bacterium]|nr:sulfatase [Planctomycetota bacterium]